MPPRAVRQHLAFLDRGPGVWRTFIVTVGDLSSGPGFEAGFLSNQRHEHWFCARMKSFEEKYLQDRFSATMVTQPHKDTRKLDGLLPVLLPRWSGCKPPVHDEVAIAQ